MADRRRPNYDNNTYDERDPYASQDASGRADYGSRDAYETRDQGYSTSRPSYTRQRNSRKRFMPAFPTDRAFCTFFQTRA